MMEQIINAVQAWYRTGISLCESSANKADLAAESDRLVAYLKRLPALQWRSIAEDGPPEHSREVFCYDKPSGRVFVGMYDPGLTLEIKPCWSDEESRSECYPGTFVAVTHYAEIGELP